MDDQTLLTQPDNQPKAPDNQPDPKQPTETKPPVATDWRTSLPDDLRSEKMFEKIKGKDAAEVLPVLAKGYRDSQKLVGASMGKLPTKPEEVKAWQEANLPKLRAAGVIEAPPESPDKYTAKLVKGGETVALPDGALDGFYAKAHSLGLTDKQAQGMLDMYVAQQADLGGSVKETMAVLEKEWGGATQMQIKTAQRAVSEVGGQEVIDMLETTGLGNHPAFIKMFARVGAVLAEDNPVFADTVRDGGDEAKAQKAKIMSDKNHPYWRREDAGHRAAVNEMKRLNEIIIAQENG